MNMKLVRGLIMICVWITLFSFTFPQPAYAYLDLGTGSYMLQVSAAAFFAGLFSLKIFWHKIKLFFKNRFTTVKKRTDAE